MSYWGSLVRSHQRELLLFKTVIQHPPLSPKICSSTKWKIALMAQKHDASQRGTGSCPPIFNYTVVLWKLCHKMCWISWVLPSKAIGVCDEKHLFCLLSARVLPSFAKAMPWSNGGFWKPKIPWESQMMCRAGWLQPDGRGVLAQTETAQGRYGSSNDGDGRRSFLEIRWDRAQLSGSRSCSKSFPTRTQLVGSLLLGFLCLRSVIFPARILTTSRFCCADNKEKD